MAARRTSFHFPKDAAARLAAVGALTHIDAESDVIRAALEAYDRLLDVVEAGWRIIVRDHAGNEWAYSPYRPFAYPGLKQVALAEPAETKGKSFFFSGEAVDRLESIRERSYVKSHTDAIRVALTAYGELLRVDAAGDEIVVRDRDGGERLYNPHRPFPPVTVTAATQSQSVPEAV
ncbi:MAG: hypothetical protein P4L64_00020 [Caulobacteraceae bacterium]|nr:hypothetical protein [Caulobacteraceae bacterium]